MHTVLMMEKVTPVEGQEATREQIFLVLLEHWVRMDMNVEHLALFSSPKQSVAFAVCSLLNGSNADPFTQAVETGKFLKIHAANGFGPDNPYGI